MNVSSEESHAFLNRLVSHTKGQHFCARELLSSTVIEVRINSTGTITRHIVRDAQNRQKCSQKQCKPPRLVEYAILEDTCPQSLALSIQCVMPAYTLLKPSVSPQVSRWLLLCKEIICDTMHTYCKSIRHVQSGVKR